MPFEMPFMEDDSTDSEGSSPNSCLSPQSTTTNATSVGPIHDVNGDHKRKCQVVDSLPRKRAKMEPCMDNGRLFPRDSVPRGTAAIPLLPRMDAHDNVSKKNVFLVECGGLPLFIWEKISMYLQPRSLGSLLQVNRDFHKLLTGSTTKPGGGLFSRDPFHKASEKIWTAARKRHNPHLPRPLHGYRELDMWKLIGGSRCQFCIPSKGPFPVSPQFHIGDNLTCQERDQVHVYWPLAVRSCQKCLGKQFATETELVSSQLSYLIPCMNFAISKQYLCQEASSAPKPGSKIYLRSHVEWLHRETLKVAKDNDSGAAELWLNRYEVNAKKRQVDAERWERWEATSGRAKLFPKTAGATCHRHALRDIHLNLPTQCRRRSPPAAVSGGSSPTSTCRNSPSPPPNQTVTALSAMAQPALLSFEEAQHAKAARVKDIVRRAAELDPPIPLSVLRHTSAYQVAHNIARRLDDFEWATLRRCLEAQREQAEVLARADMVNRLCPPLAAQPSTSFSTEPSRATATMPSRPTNAEPSPITVVSHRSNKSEDYAHMVEAEVSHTGRNKSLYSSRHAPAKFPNDGLRVSAATTQECHSDHTTRERGEVKIESNDVEPSRQRNPLEAQGRMLATTEGEIRVDRCRLQSRPEPARYQELEHRQRVVTIHDHNPEQLRSRPRPRSRSPPSDHQRLLAVSAYRERDCDRDYPVLVVPPLVREHRPYVYADYPIAAPSRVLPLRGGSDAGFYNYPPPAPRSTHSPPAVLYDESGNKYVRTAPAPVEHYPYVLYPSPPRGV